MTTKKKKQPASGPALFDVPFVCADRFLQDHAGQIISEPRTAILELIANAYDAGATEILIDWPEEKGQVLQVTDNGTGMTQDEFQKRWGKLCYDRMVEQGSDVLFPPGVKGLKRQAFGRSGKGRHAPFCFADSYEVVSKKGGNEFTVAVGLASVGNLPFEVKLINQRKISGHGTTIKLELQRHKIDVDELRQLIGSKFIVEPSLTIKVNGVTVELMSLEGRTTRVLELDGHGQVIIHFIDSIEHHRTAKLRGISWWVNSRRVGEPSWERLDDEGAYLSTSHGWIR